jgi:hypothetical protein
MRLPAPLALLVAGGSLIDAIMLAGCLAIAGIVLGPLWLIRRLRRWGEMPTVTLDIDRHRE